jgi:hypothetical protein
MLARRTIAGRRRIMNGVFTLLCFLVALSFQPATSVTNTQPPRKGNLLQNSSFELGLSRGWSILDLLPEQQLRAIDTGVARHGSASLRLDYLGGRTACLAGEFRPVRIRRTHTLSAWVRTESPGATVTLRAENGYVPTGGGPHHFEVSKELAKGQWQRLSASGISEPGPANAYAVRVIATGPVAGSVWVDAIQFEEGSLTDHQPRQPVEAALRLPDPTGISPWDEPVHYAIQVDNAGTEKANLSLRTETTDFWLRPVDRVRLETRAFSAGTTLIAQSRTLIARGSLRVKLWIDGRTEPEDEATLTVVPAPRYPARYPKSQFGQHVRLEPWQLGVARRLGAGWVRMHDVESCLHWDSVEPEPGRWVWADEKIELAHRAGLEVLGVLGRAPAWAVTDEKGGHPSHGGWVCPSDLNAWARYVETVTRHYRGKVDVWEIWNEPCWPGFGLGGDGTKYAALARLAFASAKRGNPGCTILGFCTAESAVNFNLAALAGGAMDACDLVSWHVYSGQGVDVYGRAQVLRQMLGLDRTPKRLWMTEGLGGYTSTWHSLLVDAVDDPYSREPQAPKLSGKRAAVSGAIGLASVLASGSEKVFWYWSPWEGSGSIRPDRYTWFEYDGQLKPYAAAYAVSAHFLDGARPAGRHTKGKDLVACLFERDNEAVAVLWWQGDGETKLPPPEAKTQPGHAIQASDMMGNPLSIGPAGLRLGRCPVYLTATNRRAAELVVLLGLN